MSDSEIFTTIDHVAIAGADLDEAIAFFTDKLGWTMLHRETNEQQKVHEAMMSPVADWNILQTRVQLIAPSSPESTVAKWLEKNPRGGLHHVAYRVDDIDATLALLKEREFVLIDEVPRRGTANSRIAFINPKSARGVLTEVVELAKD
jgi:methylmalonyl-CoA/ethylmalonyl-CoA epimerase